MRLRDNPSPHSPKHRRQVARTSTQQQKKANYYLKKSNPKPGHTTGRSGRGGARQGGGAWRDYVGRDAVGTIRTGDKPLSCSPAYRKHCPERRLGNKKTFLFIFKTDGGTKPAVDHRFIRGLSAGRKALFVLAADQCTDAYFYLQTLFMQGMSGRHVRKPIE